MRRRWLGWFALACSVAAQDRVDPGIAIADIHGQLQHPFQASGKGAALVFFVTNDCPISNGYAREIHRICDGYSGRASCLLDYVDPSLTVADVTKHMSDFGHGSYAAVIDKKHVLVKAAGATVTPEALVVVAGGKISYRGRIDNRYVTLGAARPAATQLDLRTAVDASIAGRPVEPPRTQAIGCLITPLELLEKK